MAVPLDVRTGGTFPVRAQEIPILMYRAGKEENTVGAHIGKRGSGRMADAGLPMKVNTIVLQLTWRN